MKAVVLTLVARERKRPHRQRSFRGSSPRQRHAPRRWGVTPFLRAIRGPSALIGTVLLSADWPSLAQQTLQQTGAAASGALVEAARKVPAALPSAGAPTPVPPAAAPEAAARLMDSYELCKIGRLGQPQLAFLTVFILIGVFVFFLQIDKRLIRHGWEIRLALSEPTTISYVSKDGDGQPLLNEKGEAVSIRVMEPSVSRLIALAGLIMLILFYFGFGIISVYHFGRTCEMPADINGVTAFLYAGLTFFAPYIATKVSEIFNPPARRLPLPSVQPQPQAPLAPSAPAPAVVAPAAPEGRAAPGANGSLSPPGGAGATTAAVSAPPAAVSSPPPPASAPPAATPSAAAPPAAPTSVSIAAPAVTPSAHAAVLEPSVEGHPEALTLIKEFEGFRDKAYPDPASGGDPWTIGYGFTRVNGKAVVPGQTMPRPEADQLLTTMVGTWATSLSRRIPFWKDMSGKQQSALLSFAWNLGESFYGDEDNFHTISQCLRNKDWAKVPEALLLYCMPGTAVHAGLLRRRQAEADLWRQGMATADGGSGPNRPIAAGGTTTTDPAAAKAPAAAHPNPLSVSYFDQMLMDDGQGWRDCFSASCAMLACFWGKLKAKDGNAYNRIRQKYGDSTDSNAQVQALRSLGLNPQFRTDGTPESLKAEIDAGRPVAVGWLHHGPVSAPSGGGHWTVVIGYDATGFWMNDPYGSCDLVGGGYPGGGNPNDQLGKKDHYSYKNWLPRWMPGGSSGWYLTCRA